MSVKILNILLVLFYKCNVDGGSLTSLSSVIQNDLRTSLELVVNSSNIAVLDSIISKMYTAEPQRNSSFMFKIPEKSGYSMLVMQRSDFEGPLYPNLTADYMNDMRNHMQHMTKTSLQDSFTTTHLTNNSTIINIKKENIQLHAAANDWSILGLDGWLGEVSRPKEPLELSVENNSIHKNNYLQHTTPIKTNIDGINIQDVHESYMDDSDVFIARVNDPFGYSTKWQKRNKTALNEDRSKRDIIKLYSMIKCSTGCDPIIYKGYGCYCGFLGNGIPVSGIDRCCKIHDKCYEQSNCISYLQYFVPYIWKCYRGKPLCAIDQGEWGSCAARLCHCDLRLSRCLRQFICPRRRAICTSSRAPRLQNFLFFK